MMESKSISVVIPNYNGRSLLERHLPAVLACLREGDEVVVVDDNSSDQSVQWLIDTFQLQSTQSNHWQACVAVSKKQIDFHLIKNRHNLRFGASSNAGVAVATRPLIFLLNSDVAPHANCVEPAVQHFVDQQVFAVGCLEEERPGGKKVVHGGKNKLWFERGLFMHSRADNFESGPTAWVSGGSGFFDRAKWLELGGFDKLFYPAYWEDIDLSMRARQRGWQILFEANSIVDHNHETTNQTAFGERKIMQISWRNNLKFSWRHGNLWQKFQFILWLPYHLVKMRHVIF